MVDLTELWLPVLVSSVVVFFASSLAWMVLPHHKKDIKVIPDEGSWIEHIKKFDLAPGTYMWPGCGEGDDMNSDAFKARYQAGPWGSVNILGAQPAFGKNLFLVFTFYVVLSVFVAYLTGEARPAGASFGSVFQIAGTTAILGYCAAAIPGAIFMGKPTRFMITEFLDGLVYGLITGIVFAWLWPQGADVMKRVQEALGG